MASLGEYRLIGSFTHIDPRVRARGGALALDGLRPAQPPRDQVSLTADWARPGAARLGVTGRYVASQFEDDQNSRRLADALTFDAVASVVLGKGFSVELRGENLTDKRVEATVGADGVVERATPRTLWVALKVAR